MTVISVKYLINMLLRWRRYFHYHTRRYTHNNFYHVPLKKRRISILKQNILSAFKILHQRKKPRAMRVLTCTLLGSALHRCCGIEHSLDCKGSRVHFLPLLYGLTNLRPLCTPSYDISNTTGTSFCCWVAPWTKIIFDSSKISLGWNDNGKNM